MSGDYYQPRRDDSGTWGFKTALGQCDGFLSRADAITAAANEERSDKYEAENGTGPIAAALRKHLTPSAA